MKKRLLVLFLSTVLPLFAIAQNSRAQRDDEGNVYKAPASDFFMFHLTNSLWQGLPDSVHKSDYSPEVGIYINKEFPINESKFAVSIGVGTSISNNFFKKQQSLNFISSDSMLIFEDSVRSYKKYKYSQVFIEAPLELRYYSNTDNKNVGFKMALGFKVGNLISAYTKGKFIANGQEYKSKIYTNKFAEKWRLVPYVRVGWGNFSLIASYQLTQVFQNTAGPKVLPINFGISISGL